MKIILERAKCIGCGSCSALCPSYFKLDDDGLAVLKGAYNNKDEQVLEIQEHEVGCAKEAAEVCPVQIIKIEK